MSGNESKQEKVEVKVLTLETMLAMVEGSVGSKTYQHMYALVNGEHKDIVKDGNLSCAFFTSSILHYHQLIKEPHATVQGTVKDLEQSGWYRIDEPRRGSLIVWEPRQDDNGKLHPHIGFYIGDDQAISNSSKFHCPTKHHWKYEQREGEQPRKVEAIYWNDQLNG